MEANGLRILIVEDENSGKSDTKEVLSEMHAHPLKINWVSGYHSALNAIHNGEYDACLLDEGAGAPAGQELFSKADILACKAPVLLISEQGNEEVNPETPPCETANLQDKNQLHANTLLHAIRYAVASKKTKAALAVEKEKLDITLKSICEGIITTDLNGCIISLNDAAIKISGWPSQAAIGKPFFEIFPFIDENTGAVLPNPALNIIRSGETCADIKNIILIDKNGDEKVVQRKGSPITDNDGCIIGAMVVLSDITKNVRHEREILQTSRLVSLGQIAGGIAHDFNNLLTAILGNIQLAASATAHENSDNYLAIAERATLRAKELTRRLATFAKGGKPEKRPTDLTNLIRESIGFALSGSNIHPTIFTQDDLYSIEVDEGQINQVLNNLLINANQSMPNGGIIGIEACNCEVTAENELQLTAGKYVQLTLTDEGTGISAQDMPKIFEPYFTTKLSGCGLGLATTHAIIKHHGGAVTVDSIPGKGTRVDIFLPASAITVQEHVYPAKKLELHQGRILIVDDEKIMRQFLVEAIHRAGLEAVAVADGRDAIVSYEQALATQHPFDVVVMDLTIPGGMGGEETIKQLKSIDPHVKAIVSSGYSDTPIMTDFMRYGFSDVICKPYNIIELHTALSRLLKKL